MLRGSNFRSDNCSDNHEDFLWTKVHRNSCRLFALFSDRLPNMKCMITDAQWLVDLYLGIQISSAPVSSLLSRMLKCESPGANGKHTLQWTRVHYTAAGRHLTRKLVDRLSFISRSQNLCENISDNLWAEKDAQKISKIFCAIIWMIIWKIIWAKLLSCNWTISNSNVFHIFHHYLFTCE